MASTTFTDNSTVIYAAWLNDVNTAVYTTIPDIIAGTQVVGNAIAAVTATTATNATNATNVSGTIASAATATTQTAGDNTTKVATTAFVTTAVAAVAQSTVVGAFRNLVASATGTSATITVTADELVLENTSNIYKTVRSISLSISGAGSGVANGLDTGTLATSTWYSLWVIDNGTTTAGLLSTSATSPTLPSGYTYKARIGWIRTDSSGNKYPLAFKQFGRKVRYVVAAGTNVTVLPVVGTGGVGTAWPTALATANFFPPGTASAVFNLVANTAASTLTFGPNSTTEMIGLGNSYSSGAYLALVAEFILESANVYWSFAGTAGSGTVAAYGWEDSL